MVRQRRAYVLETLAEIIATSGHRFVLTLDGGGWAGPFADDLAAALRLGGHDCTRDADGPAGIVVADGPSRRDQRRWDIVIYLRTPPSPGHGPGHGDGERGADVVIDYHDPGWPVIRHVSPALDHPIERLYVTETQAFFGARAFTWNAKFGDDLPAYQAAVSESGVPSGSTIVDIGCGTGRALPALLAAAGERGTVIGMDVTPEMLSVAAMQRDGAQHLVMADARYLPVATASVDVIFAAGLIQHLPEPVGGLAELARITRAGGRLIIFHPSGRAALAARHGRTVRPDEPLSHPQLVRLLDASGWCLTRYDDPPERFYALAERTGA